MHPSVPVEIDRYSEFLKYERRAKPSTVHGQRAHLLLVASKVGNLLTLHDHQPIVAALNRIEDGDNPSREPWRDTTTKKLEKSLVYFYRWAMRERLIDHNPYPLGTRRTTKASPQLHYDRKIDKETIERILFHPNWTRREYCWIRLFFACGLRRQEIVDLDIQDVDLVRGCVHVRRGKRDNERYVPFDEETKKELTIYIKALKANSRIQALFPREDFKDRMTGSGLWKSLDRMGKAMGIKCNPKVWRTSFGSYFAELIPLTMVAKLMGHARPSTTADHYVFHKDQKLSEAYHEALKQA